MKYYKDASNEIQTADRTEHEALIPAGYTEITKAEYDILRATIPNKLAELAAYRYQKETAGILVNGEVIRTDRESQSMITNTLRGFDLKPEGTTTDWETDGGEWVQINKTTLEAIGILVWDHVEACFQNKKRHSIAIKALTTAAEIEAYDFTTGWPE